MKQWGLILVGILSLISCEKTIQLQPEQQPAKLVVEAQIETSQAPIVVLSNSLNYFSTIDAATLNGSYVHNAKVTITSGNKSYTLQEVTVPVGGGYFFYYYTTNQSTPATSLFGEPGKTYNLTIETGGQQYKASTLIPLLTKKIYSLWWKPAPNNPDTNKVVLMSRVTDPPGYGNYIRYYTRVGNGEFYPGLNSVYDDQIVDGKTYDIQISKGITRNETINRDEYGYFKRGDTAYVKLCNIDKASYEFWRTWEYSYQSVGNPFSSPGKVPGNISNEALGSFCGYSAQYKTLIIPK